MHVSVNTDTKQVIQFGQSVGEREGCENIEIDDSQTSALYEDGVKTLQPDGTISVTPDLAAQAAEQARLDSIAAAEAQRTQAVQTLMAAMPSDAARGALAVVLGLPTP